MVCLAKQYQSNTCKSSNAIIYEKKIKNEFSLLFLFLFLPSPNQALVRKIMLKQSTLKQADIPHTNRVLIEKVVNVNHVLQYKDKGMCTRLGVIGVDVDADMFVWYCLNICGNVPNVWNCTSCLNVPTETYIKKKQWSPDLPWDSFEKKRAMEKKCN